MNNDDLHFEDIWNQTESISHHDKQVPEQDKLKWHAKKAKAYLESLTRTAELPLNDKTSSSITLGYALYHICALTQLMGLNPAASLQHINNHKLAEFNANKDNENES